MIIRKGVKIFFYYFNKNIPLMVLKVFKIFIPILLGTIVSPSFSQINESDIEKWFNNDSLNYGLLKSGMQVVDYDFSSGDFLVKGGYFLEVEGLSKSKWRKLSNLDYENWIAYLKRKDCGWATNAILYHISQKSAFQFAFLEQDLKDWWWKNHRKEDINYWKKHLEKKKNMAKLKKRIKKKCCNSQQ